MRITHHTPSLQPGTENRPSLPLLQNLKPGQQLRATVLGPNPAGVRLRIETTELIARTALSFRIGQQLALRVLKTGEMPQLQILQQTEIDAQKAGTLRLVLKKQGPEGQALLQSLKQGQLLQTRIEGETPQGLRLRAGATALLARPSPGLPSDLRLTLKVIKTGQQIQLQIVHQPDIGALKARALRHALPAQTGVARLFENLLAFNRGGKSDPPPTELQQALRTLLGRLPSIEQGIGAARLRQAFLESGLFLESHLNVGQPPGNDIKGILLSLLGLLQNKEKGAPNRKRDLAADGTAKQIAELLRQTTGGLARVKLQQLASLPTEESPHPTWQFELPIRQQEKVDSFLIRLEQERSTPSDETGTAWKLLLNFDLDPLGPVQTRLTLKGERISGLFLAEKAESAVLLEKNLPRLERALGKAGLDVGQLQARQGNPAAEETSPLPSVTLVDVEA